MCAQFPNECTEWFSLAKWWCNTSFHSASQITPYEVLYNQPPPLHLPYLPGESTNTAVDRTMQRREQLTRQLQQTLRKAQQRMKQLANKGRSDRVFEIGGLVWLKLQAYRQTSVQHGPKA